MIITDWIQTGATVVLVIVTIFYAKYTKTLAQVGKEPILDIKQYSILNIRSDIEIDNLSEFFAKHILIKLKRKDNAEIIYSGPKVLYPHNSGVYKAIENPVFNPFKEGEKLFVECKSILGKKTTFTYIYEEKRMDIGKEIPARFTLIDVLQ